MSHSTRLRRAFPVVVSHGTGFLLVLTAIYLSMIGALSPHPLPGFSLASGTVLFAGVSINLAATRFSRTAALARAIAFALGLFAVGAVAQVAARAPKGTHTGSSHMEQQKPKARIEEP